MISKLRPRRVESAPKSRPVNPDLTTSDDRVTAWLYVFTRLLHVSPIESEAIRDELESHLRERVRDLMLRGADESDATAQAVSELGETADLAARYDQNARIRTRRFLMQLSILGVVAAAGVLTTITMIARPTTTNHVSASVFTVAEEEGTTLPELRIDLTPEMTLREVVERLLEQQSFSVAINYKDFAATAMDPDEPLGIRTIGMPLERALRTIAEIACKPSERLAWRFDEDMLTLAPQHVFDRQSMRLVSYDLRAIVRSIADDRYAADDDESGAIASATQDVVSLLHQMVDENAWYDNGGTLARQQVVGTRLFVEAPQRMHERIGWIIGELTAAVIEPVPASAPLAATSAGSPGAGPPPGGTASALMKPGIRPPAGPAPVSQTTPGGTAPGGPAAPADR